MNYKKIRMVPTIFFIALFVVSWVSDMLTIVFDTALIYVDPSYLGNIFDATCTVAVLSNAILSLLVGASDQKIMGIPIKIVFNKTDVGSFMLQAIILPLVSIVLAILSFAFEWYTTLTALLVFDVAMILASSEIIWKLLSAKKKHAMLVSEIIRNSAASECDVYINNWFAELNKAIAIKDESEATQYVDIIKTIVENVSDKDSFSHCIERQLPGLFAKTCEAFGFAYGYAFVSQINKFQQYGYVDLDQLALEYIKQIKQSTASQIPIRDMNTTAQSIVDSNAIEYDAKWSIIYGLFCSINDNDYITLDEKQELLGSLLNYLCRLRTGENEEIKIDIILSIFRQKVLLENNCEKREWLHLQLVEYLLLRNQLNHDECYIRVISEMFRALFFYVNYETETLTQKHREGLQKLYSLARDEKDLVCVSFASLIIENQADVVSWLAIDSVSFNWRKGAQWDYFPKLSPSKHIIWDDTNVIRFAYCYYKWVGYAKTAHPFVSIVQSDTYSNDNKENICREISKLFDSNGLNCEAIQIIDQIKYLTGDIHNTVSFYNANEQAFFQDELLKLINAKNKCNSLDRNNSNENMILMVQNILNNYNCLHGNQQGGGYRYTRRRLSPTIVEKSPNRMKSAARRIARITHQIINDVVSRKLSQITIGFDLDGINTLQRNLESCNYQYRNYSYIDDLSFSSDVLMSPEYQKLKQTIESIPNDKKSAFSSRVFLTVPQIEYSLDIHYFLEEPTDSQCEEFVRSHEIADGYYQINGNTFDFTHAIRYVREDCLIEMCDLYVSVGIGPETGIKLNFRRS